MNEQIYNKYLNLSEIPKRYQTPTPLYPSTSDLEAFQRLKSIQDNIRQFVKDGGNIYLYSSNVGNGKTSWATKIGLTYIEVMSKYMVEVPVYFVNVAEFLNTKKLAMDDKSYVSRANDMEKKIRTARLVLWDDIAVRGMSEYDRNLLYILIDNRTSNQLANIYTSNIQPNELESLSGARIADRILGYSDKIGFVGSSRRKNDTTSIS